MWAEGHSLQSDKYRIKRQIGGGGFGLTYLAEDCFLKRQVVLKVPNQMFRAEQNYEKFIRRFQREGQALCKISHPNVVQVIDFFQEAGMPCLVMAYVEGETLKESIDKWGRLPQDEAVSCFQKLANALHTLHQKGLIHCDLHPGNIILRQDGEPVLIDFGSAKALQPGLLTVTMTINESFTPYEQGQLGVQPEVTLDIYGLAATLYFVVTGQKPQPALSRKLYGDTLNSPQQQCADLSDWLNDAILKGMALEPQARPSSMQAWMSLLHRPQLPAQPLPAKWQPTSYLPPKPVKQQLSRQSELSFPWVALSAVAVGYIPTGLILGLSSSEAATMVSVLFLSCPLAGVLAWNRAWAWAWAEVRTGTETGALAVAVTLMSRVLAGTIALSFVWAVSVAISVASFLVWALNGAVAVTLASILAYTVVGNRVRTEAWTMATAGTVTGVTSVIMLADSLPGELGSAASGYLTSIGGWGGIGIGLLTFIQGFTVVRGLVASYASLDERYHQFTVFVILCTISTLGLALGGVLGWWLKLSEVELPI